MALFLCSNESNEVLAQLAPEWTKNVCFPSPNKIWHCNTPLLYRQSFHVRDQLTESIDAETFAALHLTQSRSIPADKGKKKKCLQNWKQERYFFECYGNDCIALFNATKIDDLLLLNKEVVVQDYSSQRISEFLALVKLPTGTREPAISVWDCCAASGGKSLLAVDVLGNINLTVSDVRISIIENLRRFCRSRNT